MKKQNENAILQWHREELLLDLDEVKARNGGHMHQEHIVDYLAHRAARAEALHWTMVDHLNKVTDETNKKFGITASNLTTLHDRVSTLAGTVSTAISGVLDLVKSNIGFFR